MLPSKSIYCHYNVVYTSNLCEENRVINKIFQYLKDSADFFNFLYFVNLFTYFTGFLIYKKQSKCLTSKSFLTFFTLTRRIV